MPTINLLPWREMSQVRTRRRFLQMSVTSIGLTMAVILCVHLALRHLLQEQRMANRLLADELHQLVLQTTSLEEMSQQGEHVSAKLQAIASLQQSGVQVVQRLDEIVRLIPPDIILQSLAQRDNQYIATGLAESNTSILTLLDTLQKSQFFTNTALLEAKADASNQVYPNQFTLQFQSSVH